MKIRKLFKKAAALALAAVTALSVMPATTAFAAGDIGTISFTHTYDSNGNAMRYNSSAVINGYTSGGTGNYKYRMYVDGETAFCIQPGVPLKTGDTLAKASSDTWNALSSNQKKAVGLALLYGYQGNSSGLSGTDDEKWLATQTLAKVMTIPPARVRKPLDLWLGSWDCKDKPTCTMPHPSRIRPTARIRPKIKSERLFTTVNGSLAAKAVMEVPSTIAPAITITQ